MKTLQVHVKEANANSASVDDIRKISPQLGFVFGSVSMFQNQNFINNLIERNPEVKWVGCTTAGEISNKGVFDNSAVVTAVHFEKPTSKFKVASIDLPSMAKSLEVGRKLGQQLSASDLRSVIVISPGVNVNGSELVKGIVSQVGESVIVTGGLAGDGGKFEKTWTLSNEGVSDTRLIGIGFYGDGVHMTHGCMGGWDPFGKVRKVTKAKANKLFELDGQPALEVYKEYLGDHAKDLPASGLLFPFAILDNDHAETGLIRTILAVDESEGSLTFAGDIDEGCFVRLMHASTKGLVAGAATAARGAASKGTADGSLALLVSCVGRKLVMGGNVDEEVEAVSEILGSGCSVTGFYSYGEISPYINEVACKLHNQTMTISYIFEK